MDRPPDDANAGGNKCDNCSGDALQQHASRRTHNGHSAFKGKAGGAFKTAIANHRAFNGSGNGAACNNRAAFNRLIGDQVFQNHVLHNLITATIAMHMVKILHACMC